MKFFQTGLKNLGYYSGKVDGKSSKEFREALSAFQKDNKATPSGFINFESYERLMKNYVKQMQMVTLKSGTRTIR